MFYVTYDSHVTGYGPRPVACRSLYDARRYVARTLREARADGLAVAIMVPGVQWIVDDDRHDADPMRCGTLMLVDAVEAGL